MSVRAGWACCALLGLCACSTDITPLTQIVVVVDSDLDVPDELNRIAIDVSQAAGMPSATAQLRAADELPRSLGIVYGGGPLGPVLVTARGLRDDETVVTRAAQVWFRKDKSLSLSLSLTRACRDVATPCDDDQTCADGACVDQAIATLPTWNGKRPVHGMTPGADGGTPAADGGGSDANSRGAGGGGTAAANGGASGNGDDNRAPTCHIDQPSVNDRIFVGDTVKLSGSCSDPDGASPISVSWHSSLDDDVGFQYSTQFMPSSGTHTLTFCGADRRDSALLGCDEITITVEPLPDISAMIASIKQGSSTNPPFSADSDMPVIASGSGTGVDPLSLLWTDSLIGEIGSDDNQMFAMPAAVGKHALSLTVTDARSRKATTVSSNFNVLAQGQSSLFVGYDMVNSTINPPSGTGTATGPVVAIDADANNLYVASQGSSGMTMTSALYQIGRSSAPETANPVLLLLSLDPMQQVRDVYLHASSGRAYLALSGGYAVCNYSLAGGIDTKSCMVAKAAMDKPCASAASSRILRVTSSGSAKDYVLLGSTLGLCVCDAMMVGNCSVSTNLSGVAVTSFAVGSGALWVGTDNGLYKVDLSASDGVNNPIKVSAVSGAIRALALGDNALWVGSASGVTRLDLSNNSTNFWGTSTSAGAFAHLISSDIHAISVSRPVLGVSGQRDVAWIATGVGVSRFDSTIPSFTSFSSGDGLPSNSVRAVLVLSNGDKVIGTDSGLALYRGP